MVATVAAQWHIMVIIAAEGVVGRSVDAQNSVSPFQNYTTVIFSLKIRKLGTRLALGDK